MTENNLPKVRLDKWLWFARQVKTRSLAQKVIATGKIRINSEKTTSPKKLVGPSDVLTISISEHIKVLKILECGKKRGPYEEAKLLYEDLSQPIPKKQKTVRISAEPVIGKRPDKRSRKQAQIIIGKIR